MSRFREIFKRPSSEPPKVNLSRRDFLLGFHTVIATSVLAACTPGGERTLDTLANLGKETENGEPIDTDQLLIDLLSDPLVYSAFSESESGALNSPLLTLAAAEAAKQGSSIYLEMVSEPLATQFKDAIAPVLLENGLTQDEILNIAVRRKVSSMGDIYRLDIPNGKSFYLRLTPLTDPENLANVRAGTRLQRNMFERLLGRKNTIIFELPQMTHPETGLEVAVTVAEELGKPLGAAKQALGEERLRSSLIDYFTDVLVPSATQGFFKQDINGTNASNILFDLDHFNKTGQVRFTPIDFAEKAVGALNPESGVRHAYQRLQRVFRQLKIGELPPLESLASHPNLKNLNLQLMQSDILPINYIGPDRALRRAFIPQKLVNRNGKTDREVFEQILEFTRKVEAGEDILYTPDGIPVRIVRNQLDDIGRLRKLAEILRPGAKVLGFAAGILNFIGYAQLINNADRKLTTSVNVIHSFEEGENQLSLDKLFQSANHMKKRQMENTGKLAEFQRLTNEQERVLKSQGIDPQVVHDRLVAQDPFPAGLINENLAQAGVFDIMNGQVMDATLFLSAIESGEGDRRIIFYRRGYDIHENGTDISLNNELHPVMTMIKIAGDSGWQLDEATTMDFNYSPDEHFILDYTSYAIPMGGRRGGHPPAGEVRLGAVQPGTNVTHLPFNFSPYN